eukprot:14276654-Alexandrium_andersonii.AAC.1
MATVKFFLPQFGRGGHLALPLAGQALRGFKLKAPALTRLPLPWEAVALWALSALDFGDVPIAIYILMTFHGYLRPAELLRVR